MTLYPYKFRPIYKEKIWGGRNLERLYGRALPEGQSIGESWELADLAEGVSIVCNGPSAGMTLRELTEQHGSGLIGPARLSDEGRFPLLLKLLDANDILSLQVHPDTRAVAEIGPPAALKTECWYIVESRDGMIYKGVKPGVTGEQFRAAIENDSVEQLVEPMNVAEGDFHYLPAGTVHALGAGVVVAEVQTPSDTTYRVTDWGRGREIHVDRSMQCIRFDMADTAPPGADGEVLLDTEYFRVEKRTAQAGRVSVVCEHCCTAMMVLEGEGVLVHDGMGEIAVDFTAGDTLLLPAGLEFVELSGPAVDVTYLAVTLTKR